LEFESLVPRAKLQTRPPQKSEGGPRVIVCFLPRFLLDGRGHLLSFAERSAKLPESVYCTCALNPVGAVGGVDVLCE